MYVPGTVVKDAVAAHTRAGDDQVTPTSSTPRDLFDQEYFKVIIRSAISSHAKTDLRLYFHR